MSQLCSPGFTQGTKIPKGSIRQGVPEGHGLEGNS